MKKVAIIQSCYIPWRGYFDIIRRVDEFILHDDIQYTKLDWRNRNKINTPNGAKWLSIPVRYLHVEQLICNTEVVDADWTIKHRNLIQQNYKMSPFWNDFKVHIYELYEAASKEKMLSKINYIFLRGIADILGIKTKFSWSMDYHAQGKKTDRLLDILQKAGATHYLSGPSAKNYIEEEKFENAQIELEWMEYNYHGVSILDTLFMTGSEIYGK